MRNIEDKGGEYSSKSFKSLNLFSNELTSKEFDDCVFEGCGFSYADFYNTDFTNSFFNKTNLTGVRFTEMMNHNIHLIFNEVSKAKLSQIEVVILLERLDIELVD